MKDGSDPQAQLVYPSGKRDAFLWDLKAAFDFAKPAADEFKVGASGEHAFERSKVEAKLKKKEEEKAATKAKRKPAKA